MMDLAQGKSHLLTIITFVSFELKIMFFLLINFAKIMN